MKVGSLFSGIGGFDLGLERAGMQIVWQSEVEPYCCKVLKKHWPEVPNLGDIFEIQNSPAVDLICGGFPCQPFSIAGKRQGKADDRYLWPEMLRIITEVKPRWVFAENVLGIIGMELDQVLSDLESEGYETGTIIIPACALNAPHRRNRIWILGYADTIRCSRLSREKSEIQDNNTHLHRGNGIATHTEHDRCNGKEVCVSGRGSQQAPVDSAKTDCHAPDSAMQGFSESQEGERKDSLQDAERRSWEAPWPEVATRLCRVDDGLPAWVHRHRVKRLKALGNAIVPQIAEEIGKMIMKLETS